MWTEKNERSDKERMGVVEVVGGDGQVVCAKRRREEVLDFVRRKRKAGVDFFEGGVVQLLVQCLYFSLLTPCLGVGSALGFTE